MGLFFKLYFQLSGQKIGGKMGDISKQRKVKVWGLDPLDTVLPLSTPVCLCEVFIDIYSRRRFSIFFLIINYFMSILTFSL